MMDGYTLETKTVQLNKEETLDDIFEKIRTIAELPFAIESVVIFKNSLQFKYWKAIDGFTIPEVQQAPNIEALLATITITDISLEDEELGINLDAVGSITKLMMKAQSYGLSGSGIVVSNRREFAQWLGVKKMPHRFLDMSVFEYDAIGERTIVLLAGKAKASLPHDAIMAFVSCMEIKDG